MLVLGVGVAGDVVGIGDVAAVDAVGVYDVGFIAAVGVLLALYIIISILL